MSRCHRVEARLSWQEYADLNALVLRRGLSRSGLMRRLITEAINRSLERDALIGRSYPQQTQQNDSH